MAGYAIGRIKVAASYKKWEQRQSLCSLCRHVEYPGTGEISSSFPDILLN